MKKMKPAMPSSAFAGLAIIPICVLLLAFVHNSTTCTDTVYVSTSDGYLVISKDEGETWSTLIAGDRGFLTSVSAQGENVFVATSYGVAVSHDGGLSWSIRNLQANASCDPSVESVFVASDKRLYALVLGGGYDSGLGCSRVALSTDNGETWPIDLQLPSPPFGYVQDIYVDGQRIYVASTSGLGISEDLGRTWKFMNESDGLGTNSVYCILGRGQSIYAGLAMDGGQVSMSEDGGSTWKTANTTPSTGLIDYVYSMYLQDDNTLYVATWGGGLSWSNDFTNWTRKMTMDGLGSNYTMAITGSGNSLYLGTDRGLSISRDSGQTWSTKTTKDGLPSDYIYSVFTQCV